MGQMSRVGVYGGSFDPIHTGHLAIAEEARAVLGLTSVRVVPAARQPLKAHLQGAAADHRMAMVRIACADNPAFLPDDLELQRSPPSYTFDTLVTLRERLGPDTQLWFIMGADVAHELPRWHRISELLALTRLAIVCRPGYSLDLPALERTLPALAGRYAIIEGPRLDIASSELRHRLAGGRPVRYLIPEGVRRYIEEHGLYRGASTGAER